GQGRFPNRKPAFLRGRLVKALSQPAALTGVDEPGCQTATAAIPSALVCCCGRWLPTWRLNPRLWPIRRVANPKSALADAHPGRSVASGCAVSQDQTAAQIGLPGRAR